MQFPLMANQPERALKSSLAPTPYNAAATCLHIAAQSGRESDPMADFQLLDGAHLLGVRILDRLGLVEHHDIPGDPGNPREPGKTSIRRQNHFVVPGDGIRFQDPCGRRDRRRARDFSGSGAA